ncbi:MAG: 50S ribosomal protein L32 [Candidatus Glassbacteria bacterium]|nr:50S ribosomal protein L32 [Candidatus Glassbacteria bacterium]
MAVPRRKTSKSAKRKRRTHFKLNPKGLSECSNCGQLKLPHQVCESCGQYNGRDVLEVVE